MVKEYAVKIASVNLERGKSEVIEISSAVARQYIGGVGMAARILWDETSAATDPFSPENRLMFMAGPLTGKMPQSSRTLVCGISPANDAWGEAAMGGSWGAELGNTGFSGLVISGKAKKPVYIYIKDGDVRIEDASHLWGKDTFETSDMLQAETDGKASVAAIGRAGERLVRIAGVVADGRFGRTAARCGLGGVMGSKNLKAVVVRGTKKPPVVNEATLGAINREVNELLSKIKSGALGPPPTAPGHGMGNLYSAGSMSVKNHSAGRWENFYKKYKESPHGQQLYCRTCPVSCGESRMQGETRQQVMHMTISVGSNCYIDDFDALQQGYELCNRYGIDSISFGYVLSFAMELFEKGIISREDTGGIDLTWGNKEAMLEMLRQIGESEGFGQVLAQGTRRAAEQIGKGAIRYAQQVKGLEMPFFDARIFSSLLLGYATGNKGASHYESPGHKVERRRPDALYGLDISELGFPEGFKCLGLAGKARLTKKIQDAVCLTNSLVVCQFSYLNYGVKLATYLRYLNAITGWDMTFDDFVRVGERAFNLKRLINLRRGLTGNDDTLPPRVMEKLPDVSDDEQYVPDPISFQESLQEYYALRGWDKSGIPTPEKLSDLGLLR